MKSFTEFCRVALHESEANALLLAVADSKGVRWTLPRPGLAWDALGFFARDHLSTAEVQRYQRVLEERSRRSEPLVSPALVARAKDLQRSQRRPRARPKTHPIKRALPTSSDEWVERQIEEVRAWAKRRHVANQQTKRYQELRKRRLAKAGYQCEKCSSPRDLQLHHRHYGTLGRERLSDVVILCDACHVHETERQAALTRARWKPIGTGKTRRTPSEARPWLCKAL